MHPRPSYESDLTPSRELVERFRLARHSDDDSASLAVIHFRGTQVEYDLGLHYVASTDSLDRAVGAEILAQLGWGDQTFREESVDALLPLLSDPVEEVICAAAVALGHRRAERAIPMLLTLMDHPNPRVRYGVTYGLLGLEDERAIEGLIRLSRDDDRDTRSWATFGLGSQIDADSPALRACLRERLSDPDNEVRGEALVGLAVRREPSVVAALHTEWQRKWISLLSLEAAAEIGDPRLLPALIRFSTTLDIASDSWFADTLAEAITACTPPATSGVGGGSAPPSSP